MKRIGIKLRSGILVVLAAATIALCHLFPNAATNPETGMVMVLPDSIPGSVGFEIPMGKQEKELLPEDTTILRRIYVERGHSEERRRWRQMVASLVLMGTDRRSLHEPEFCMRALGWQFKPGKVVTIETTGGPLKVKELELRRWKRGPDGTPLRDEQGRKIPVRAHYFYWWVSRDGSTPHSKRRIALSALNNMFRNVNDRWGYPSVQVMVDPVYSREEGREEARERALEFIREYAPGFQKSLGATPDDGVGEDDSPGRGE